MYDLDIDYDSYNNKSMKPQMMNPRITQIVINDAIKDGDKQSTMTKNDEKNIVSSLCNTVAAICCLHFKIQLYLAMQQFNVKIRTK